MANTFIPSMIGGEIKFKIFEVFMTSIQLLILSLHKNNLGCGPIDTQLGYDYKVFLYNHKLLGMF